MKITNFKLPVFNWTSSWGATLNFRLTQIVQNIVYAINRFTDGYLYPTKSVTATYSANVSDTIILANGTFTVTLPDPSICKDKRFVVKNTGVGTITIVGITGQIDSAANIQLTVTMESIDLVSDGANYWVI